MTTSQPCEHCERVAERDDWGLCSLCASVASVRVLYSRRRGWTPQWEENLRRLTRRAQARLPLFDGPELSEEHAA